MSDKFKIFLILTVTFIIAHGIFELAYEFGEKHGANAGKLIGVYDCMHHMNKLAITLTKEAK